MINIAKDRIKRNKVLRKLIIPIVDKTLLYEIYKKINIAFTFKMRSGEKIKFYPEGQIAFGIFTNKFELTELDTFQKIIKKGMTVVDAGANIGLYSVIASKLTGNQGKVFSFEPSRETFKRLTNNINLNNAANVISENCGLGENPDEILTLRQDVGSKDAERYMMPSGFVPDTRLINVNDINSKEEIRIDTLDNYLEKKEISSIDFLKIDTEGFEYYILAGAKRILKNSPDVVILMECTAMGTARANTTQKKVFDLLYEYGFNIYYWDDHTSEWRDDDGIYECGDVWVCKDKSKLIA